MDRLQRNLIRRRVQRKFEIGGYTLKVEALNEVLSFLGHFPDEEEEAIDILLLGLQRESLKSSILDPETVHRVVSLLLEPDVAADHGPSSGSSSSSALRITDAFNVPKLHYDSVKKVFREHSGKLPIHGDAPTKAMLYRVRFLLLQQRLSCDPNFSSSAFDIGMSDSGSSEISTIQSLVGLTGITGRKVVMGFISKLEDGHFYLKDLTASVKIKFSDAKITTGFFLESTIVLAEGEMQWDGIFQVKTFGFPPLEDREKSIKAFPGLDFFGCGTLTNAESLRLAEMETRSVNDMFVVLSDIWLDNEETMRNLEEVLNRYEKNRVVPSLFVFMGNFCSSPCNISFSSLRLQFGRLGRMIERHSSLNNQSKFLFIPGPDDIGPSTALPRCALPKYLTDELQKRVRDAIFSSNPCRVKFYTQEIVFFPQDLLYRIMHGSCLIPPSKEETNDLFEHLVVTITHQSHLCPLPPSAQPIIWNYDHYLHLFPTPHTIVMADKNEQKVFNYKGTTCFNPGSFSNDGTFAVYLPCTRKVELSAL